MGPRSLIECLRVALAVAAVALSGTLSAVASSKAMGMGGAAVAFGQDAITAFFNPANIIMVGDRSDVGVSARFSHRSLDLSNRPDPLFDTGEFRSIQTWDVYGEGGAVSTWDCYGIWSGGIQWNNYDQIHVHYKTPLTDFSGFTFLGDETGTALKFLYRVDVLTATLAYTWDWLTVGAAANGYVSWLDVTGLERLALDDLTTDPANLTNRATDNANGIGFTFGMLGQFFCDSLAVGFSWSPKVSMQAFDKYRGLLATHTFDIPEIYRAGVSWTSQCNCALTTLALDGEWKRYSQVQSWSNNFPGSTGGAFEPLFGTQNGPGFGWTDQWIVKAGVNHRFSDYWAVRVGYRHEKCPIPKNGGTNTALNVLTLNTIQDYVSIGLTLYPDCMSEITAYGEYGFNRRVSSSYPEILSNDDWASGDLRFHAYTVTMGLGYGLKF